MPKQIVRAPARAAILRGLADMVGETLRPGSNTSEPTRLRRTAELSIQVFHDQLSLNDRLSTTGAEMIWASVATTNGSAGDGRATAAVLAQSLYKGAVGSMAEGGNAITLKRGIDLAVSAIGNECCLLYTSPSPRDS